MRLGVCVWFFSVSFFSTGASDNIESAILLVVVLCLELLRSSTLGVVGAVGEERVPPLAAAASELPSAVVTQV